MASKWYKKLCEALNTDARDALGDGVIAITPDPQGTFVGVAMVGDYRASAHIWTPRVDKRSAATHDMRTDMWEGLRRHLAGEIPKYNPESVARSRPLLRHLATMTATMRA